MSISLNNIIIDLSCNSLDNENFLPPNDVNEDIYSNLSQILLSHVSIPSYQLSKEEIEWIQLFINISPSTFTKLTKDLLSITADGRIDLYEIPKIVKLLADIYYTDLKNSIQFDAKNIIKLIKFTIDVIIESPLLILPYAEKEVIKDIVEYSIFLLEMKVDTIDNIIDNIEVKSKNCWPKLARIFYK